jgi:hypothetical protein
VGYDFLDLVISEIYPSFHMFELLFKSTEIRLIFDIFLGSILMGVTFFAVYSLPFFKCLSKHTALPFLFSFPIVFTLVSANERLFDVWLYSSTYTFFVMVFVLLGFFKLFNIVNK